MTKASTRCAAMLALAICLPSCLSYNKLSSNPNTGVTLAVGFGEIVFAGLTAISADAPGFDDLSRTETDRTPHYGERFAVSLLTVVFADALVAGIVWMIDQDAKSNSPGY